MTRGALLWRQVSLLSSCIGTCRDITHQIDHPSIHPVCCVHSLKCEYAASQLPVYALQLFLEMHLQSMLVLQQPYYGVG